MASSPQWKVYDRDGKYQAACRQLEAAGALVAFYGDGATLRFDHAYIVWTEGREATRAGASTEAFRETVECRLRARHRVSFSRAYGR